MERVLLLCPSPKHAGQARPSPATARGSSSRCSQPIPDTMTSVPDLQVQLHTAENELFEGLCTDLDSSEQAVVALVAFSPDRAPAIGLGETTGLTFLGGGLVSSIEVEGITVLRADDRSRRYYSFQLGDVPKSMLLLLANRRGSTRLAPRGDVRINLLDLPQGVPSQVALHDISATGLSLIVGPALEKALLKQVRLRFSLCLPGEDAIELVASIRHRRIFGAQFLYGLEFDGQIPSFMRAQERFLSYLTGLR